MAAMNNKVIQPYNHNLETFFLFWLDAQVNATEENRQTQKKLRQIINHLRTFDDQDQCQQCISYFSEQDRVILIVSGQLGRQIVPQIHRLRQLSAIYVYCRDKQLNDEWARHYTKVKNFLLNFFYELIFIQVKGVIVQLDDLINQIRSDQINRMKIEEPLSINIYTFNSNEDQSTTELNGHFVHSLLLIDVLLRMKSNQKDKQQLIERCYNEYKDNDNELSIVQEFEREYLPYNALRWYTRESFVHKMLNKALRTQNIELLFLFRFIIHDIYEQLKRCQYHSPIRVYRGQVMSHGELKILRRSINNFISINSFFSTSVDDSKAMSFSNDSNISHDLHPVLFVIDANPSVVKTKPFADISCHSDYNEREVLFMVGCVFRLIDIRQNGQISMIYMRLCGDDEHDMQDLFRYMKKEYAGGDKQVDLNSFGAVLYKMGKYDHAEMVYHRLLNEISLNDPILSSVYRSLGMITEDKGEYNTSLKWYQNSLQTQMRINPSNHIDIGGIYCCIGVVYKKTNDYNKALDCYYKAIELFQKAHDDNHRDMASFYNNIAIIYNKQKQFSKALNFYEKMLSIERKHLPADHPDLGMSYNNIGLVYFSVGQYDLAMSYYNQSLEIKFKSLPSEHPLIAKSYVNIGRVYEARKDWRQALIYFEKAAAIRYNALSSHHPDVIKIQKDIQRVSSKMM